jgi:hypothetical protein
MKLYRITIENETKTLIVKDLYVIAESERLAEIKAKQFVALKNEKKVTMLKATSVAEITTQDKKLVL